MTRRLWERQRSSTHWKTGNWSGKKLKGGRTMGNLFKIAIRNLLRYKRRTLLTASLITIGVVFVLGFIGVSGSFKNMMIAQITDSSLGHLQVHRRGYMAAVESLPLTMNLMPKPYKILEDTLKGLPDVESYSPRLRF